MTTTAPFLRLAAVVAALYSLDIAHARVPDIISYQGRIRAADADFTGAGQFKFALLKGRVVMWLNSADRNGDDEPDQPVTLPVTNGLFTVGLGDTALPNMASLTAATIPFNDPGSSPVVLRVWFSDGISGFAQLTPDQPLHSAAYAQEAKTVPPGSIGAAQLADGGVGSNQLANGSIHANKLAPGLLSKLDAADGNPANVVRVDTNGTVLVRGSGFENAFQGGSLVVLNGTRNGPRALTSVSSGLSDERSGVTTLAGATAVAISGNTAFVAARDDDAVTAINITDPAGMVVLGSIRQGGAVTSLDQPESIAVAGNFAFVASRASDSMTILNVANPAAITVASFVRDGVGGVNDLDAPIKVSVLGNFAYVLADGDDAVSIFNVANKNNPTLVFVIKQGVLGLTTFNVPSDVQAVGNRLYVVANTDLFIFDITNPNAPTRLFPSAQASISAWSVEVSGNTAYVGDSFGAIRIYDVTTATNPVLRSSIQLIDQGFVTAFNVGFVSPSDLALDGTNLFAALPEYSRLYTLDVSNPTAPNVTHFSSAYGAPGVATPIGALLGVRGLGVAGGRVFAASREANSFISLQKPTTGSGSPVSLVMDGSLGVGTRNPAAQFHVFGGSTILETEHLTFGRSSAPGFYSAALGEDCLVTGGSGFALGQGLENRLGSSVVVGRFNFVTNAIFAVGIGTATFRSNALTITSSGNIGLAGVHGPANPIQHISGARLTSGGTWTSASDVNLKENLKSISAPQVLDKIVGLPLYEWNYKVEGPRVRHLSPTAQDFRAAFGLGEDDKTIATLDAGGVALAAIQGLNQKLTEELKAKDSRIMELERRLSALEKLIQVTPQEGDQP
jgi:hypothetical protein